MAQRLLRFGLCLFAAAMPLSITGADTGEIVAGLGLIVLLAGAKRAPRIRTELEVPWAVYLAVAILVSALGVAPMVSLRVLQGDFRKVILFYVLSAALVLDPKVPVFKWYAAGIFAAAAIAFAQILGAHAPPFIQSKIATLGQHHFFSFLLPTARAHGTVHAVTFGEIMCFALLGGICSWPNPRKGGAPAPKPKLVLFCLAAAAALVLSQTRGAWLGLLPALAVLVWFRRELLRPLAGLALAAGLGLALVSAVTPLHLGDRVRSIFDPNMPSNAIRLELWKTGLAMFKDHPATGVGVGNYRTLFPQYHPALLWGEDWGNAHDAYIHQLAERGILGLGALLALLTTMVATTLRRCRKDPAPIHLWALSALAAFLVMNLTETAFQDSMAVMPVLFLYVCSERGVPAALP